MTPDLLDRLRPHARIVNVAAGQVIVWEGAPQRSLYIVASGRVTATLLVRGEMESILGEIGPGGIFGELALIDEGLAAATIVAEAPTILWRFDATASLFTDPTLVLSLLQSLCAKVRSANERLGEAVAWGLTATSSTSVGPPCPP